MIDKNNSRSRGEIPENDTSHLLDDAIKNGESSEREPEESIVDEARRTSEAAGLAHWTEPPTGHVPKVLDGNKSPSKRGDGAGASLSDQDGWSTPDILDPFSDPEPLIADRAEVTDGFGSRTQDPLVGFSVDSESNPSTSDPLADFAAIPGSVTHDPLADFEPAPNRKNFTEEVPAVGSDDTLAPPVTATSSSTRTPAEVLDLTLQEEEQQIDLADPAEIASRTELRPKHRTASPQKRSVFDLPPAEVAVGDPAPAPKAGKDRKKDSAKQEHSRSMVNDMVGYGSAAEPAEPEPSPDPLLDLGTDQTRKASVEGLLPPGSALSPEDTPDPVVGGSADFEIDSDRTVPVERSIIESSKSTGTGRDLIQATSVGFVLAALAGVALWAGPVASACLIAGFAVLAVIEFYNAMSLAGLRPASLLGIIGVASIQVSVYFQGPDGYPLVTALLVIYGALWYLVGADKERPVLNLGLTIMGLLWVGGLAGFGILTVREPLGMGLFLTAILVTVVSDTLAYVGGRLLGSTPFHQASPNKTWEGTLTGFAGALFCGLIVGLLDIFEIFDGSAGTVIILAAVVGVLAPLGDLAESMMKRDLGVKDMGTLLPGHGGVMDRLDGLLFALPGAYYVGMVFNLL